MRNKGLESIVVEFGVAAFALLLPQEGKHTSKQHTHEDSKHCFPALSTRSRDQQLPETSFKCEKQTETP